MRTIVLSTALALAGAVPAAAEEQGSRETRDYVQAAGHSDAFEMLEADTALAQSSDPQVRAFAQKMVAEHGQTSQALTMATMRAGVAPPPMGVGADQAPLLAALQSLRGHDFDVAYWRHQVLAHNFALTTTKLYAANGDNPEVRQAAASAVPVISAHLTTAQQMTEK